MPGPRPTIITPHGGPHSAYTAQFFMPLSFMVALGESAVRSRSLVYSSLQLAGARHTAGCMHCPQQPQFDRALGESSGVIATVLFTKVGAAVGG